VIRIQLRQLAEHPSQTASKQHRKTKPKIA
jgi:hypothetical protein